MRLFAAFLLLLSLPLYAVEPVISLELDELMLMLDLSTSSTMILQNSKEQIEDLKASQKNEAELLNSSETAINNSVDITLSWQTSINNFETNNNAGTVLLNDSSQTISSLQTTTDELQQPFWKSPGGQVLTYTLIVVISFGLGWGGKELKQYLDKR